MLGISERFLCKCSGFYWAIVVGIFKRTLFQGYFGYKDTQEGSCRCNSLAHFHIIAYTILGQLV